MGYGWGMSGVGWIAMTVFWVALIVLVVWLVTRAFPGDHDRDGRGGTDRETAEQILDRRFASGEIDLDTYRAMRAAIAAAPPADPGGP